IQSVLLADGNGAHVAFAAEFISGRRSYLCRPFTLTSHSNKTHVHLTFAVILERSSRKSLDACQVAARFHLTPREQETLQYLIQVREPSAALIYVRKGTSRSKAPAPLSVCLRGESPGLAFIRGLQSSPGSHPRNSPGHQFRGLIPAGQSCGQTFQPRAL